MAIKTLICGLSGTGKSTSARNLKEVAVVNPVNKPLPFKNHFEMLNGVTDSAEIIKFMKKTKSKVIIVDDFQYLLSIPYMRRIKESGWDKYNDFASNYFDIINVCDELPEDVTVYFMSHTETLEDGTETVKLIGKLLREKICIEGLFTTVLKTLVNDGKYYFITQNSGRDTVKSPLGMFDSYAIDNDLAYVDAKIRSYYEIGENFLTDEEMAEIDEEAKRTELEPPKPRSERKRRGSEKPKTGKNGSNKAEKPENEPVKTTDDIKPMRQRKTREQVEADNQGKMADYLTECDKALDEATNGATEVDFDEANKITENIPAPELDPVPRRRRRRTE